MKNLFKKLFLQETQTKSSYNKNEDYWKQHCIEERKKLIDKIEKLKKIYKVEADIYIETADDANHPFIQNLSKDEMMPKSLLFYNYLLNLAVTTQDGDIYLVEKILDIIISHKKEENVENSHRNWMSEQREYIEKRKEFLKHKEKELEEREANIVKIEAAQKILNSNLVDKINNEGDKND